jgi:hypothetical protein
MNELIVKGKQEFLGKQVPIIKGGFGENQKCVLARDIALIHEVETKTINQLISNNLDEFEEGIDLIDMKSTNDLEVIARDLGFITSNGQKYCYLLSEQGYIALVGLMKTQKSREIRKQFRREYFLMKELIEDVSKQDNKLSERANNLIDKIDSSLSDLSEYYKPTHKNKLDLNKYIRNCLGVNYTRDNSDRVKEITLTLIGNYKIWEEVPIEILNSQETSKTIYNVCKDLNNQFGQIQESFF